MGGIRNACPCLEQLRASYVNGRVKLHSPFIDHINDIRVFMNTAVIHYYHGIRARVWLHCIEEFTDEILKGQRAKRAFENLAMEDPIM